MLCDTIHDTFCMLFLSTDRSYSIIMYYTLPVFLIGIWFRLFSHYRNVIFNC